MRHADAAMLIAATAALVIATVAGGCAPPAVRAGLGSVQAQQTQFTRLDRDDDGYLEARELDASLRLRREFGSWDADRDGRISFLEFDAYVADVMG